MDIHATGCYTSQAAMKLYNRRNEQLGDAAERISVMADYIDGASYPANTLTDAWRRFIWHQFHDDLTGTSLPQAYTYSWNDELISQTQFNDIIRTGVGSLASCLDTRVKGTALIVYNAMAAQRKDWQKLYKYLKGACWSTSFLTPTAKKFRHNYLIGKTGKHTLPLVLL